MATTHRPHFRCLAILLAVVLQAISLAARSPDLAGARKAVEDAEKAVTAAPGNAELAAAHEKMQKARAARDAKVESLLASPNYPDNPFRSDGLRAFDSLLVFPDDAREGYGARIQGVFIPPVSGNWVFFARTRNLEKAVQP